MQQICNLFYININTSKNEYYKYSHFTVVLDTNGKTLVSYLVLF